MRNINKRGLVAAVAFAVTTTLAQAAPAHAAGPSDYTGPLGLALRAAGLAGAAGLELHERPAGTVPVDLAGVYDVTATGAAPRQLVVIHAPDAAGSVPTTAWLLYSGSAAPSAWLVRQASGTLPGTAVAVAAPPSAPAAAAGITGCDIAGEIIGNLIPGAGLLFTALCNAPGPEDGIRWAWYDPIFPQGPADYYDRQEGPHVGDDPYYQILDVHYRSHRCYQKEPLTVFSNNPNNPYRGSTQSCVWIEGSEPQNGYYPVITAQYYTRVVWVDRTKQDLTFSTNKNDTFAPTVYRWNQLVPTGEYTSSATASEFWPEYCGPTYSPLVDPRSQYACKVGQVRAHVKVVRTF